MSIGGRLATGATGTAAPVIERVSFAVLLAGVSLAPWAPTPMSRGAAYTLSAVLAGGVMLWGAAVLLARRLPRVPIALLTAIAIVLAYGWLMTLNGHPDPVLARRVFPRGHVVSWLPGAVDRRVALDVMLPLSAALVTGVALIDLARDRLVRMALLTGIAWSAAAMSAAAAIDRWGGWSWPSVDADIGDGGTRFGAFGYHGNAAAYLELALAAALLVMVSELASTRSIVRRVIAVAAPCLILVGCSTNVSKLGQVLAVAIVIAFCFIVGRGGRIHRPHINRAVFALGALAVVIISVGAFAARDRWKELPDNVGADSGRALVWETAARSSERSPVFGSGPGGFKLLLPEVAASETPDLYRHWIVRPYHHGDDVTIWMYAHDDALQTLVEWGPLVGTILAGLVLWPLAASVRAVHRSRRRAIAPAMAALALATVYAHSLVDFPLQIFAVQLTVTAWAAIAINGAAEIAPSIPRTRRSATT